jgi:hypothetical protein
MEQQQQQDRHNILLYFIFLLLGLLTVDLHFDHKILLLVEKDNLSNHNKLILLTANYYRCLANQPLYFKPVLPLIILSLALNLIRYVVNNRNPISYLLALVFALNSLIFYVGPIQSSSSLSTINDNDTIDIFNHLITIAW